MDQIKTNHQIVMCILRERAAYLNPALPDELQLRTVFDIESGQYLLVEVGWQGRRRVFNVELYIQIADDLIWIEVDETEDGIATDLLAHGIPHNKIVLGFYHPSRRELTEFAFAV